MPLSLVMGGKTESVNKYSLYKRVYHDSIIKANRHFEKTQEFSKDHIKKIVFAGVKMINASSSEPSDYDSLIERYQNVMLIENAIGSLTPLEFKTLFPLAKEFDGKRYEMKDYFYSIEQIKEFGENRLISDNVMEFLWDYHCWEVNIFLSEVMCIISGLRRHEGKKGIAEQFFEDAGVPTYSMTETNGKKFIVNNQTGEMTRYKKPIPRGMKVLSTDKE